ncbi:MAG: hypothetical protein AAGH90_12290, partial [Pseudomonadota bacterium]
CDDCDGKGGPCCKSSGSKGRQVISELLTISPALSDAIAKGDSQLDILKSAKEDGFRTIRDDAARVVREKIATPDAIERAIGSEM